MSLSNNRGHHVLSHSRRGYLLCGYTALNPALKWAFSSVFSVWNLFYIHKELPECASILNSVWWIFHAVSCTLLWRKIGLHSYTARPFRGTINYRNHCVCFTRIAVTQTSQRNKRKNRRENVWDSQVFLGKVFCHLLVLFINSTSVVFTLQHRDINHCCKSRSLGVLHHPMSWKCSFVLLKGLSLFPMGQLLEASEQKKLLLQRKTMSQNTFKYTR